MIGRALRTLGVVLLAGPAAALTCAPPDAVRSYEEARDAAETFVAVHGRFVPDPGARPVIVDGDGGHVEIRGRMEGRALGPRGFVTPYAEDITFRGECIGPWCVSGPPEGDILGFVELAPDGPRLVTNACSARIVAAPSPEALRAVIRCHRRGVCQPVP